MKILCSCIVCKQEISYKGIHSHYLISHTKESSEDCYQKSTFLKNKYHKWYFNIINKAKSRLKPDCYCENHHILPKSMGGGDDKNNMVYLTAREHFICHYLLCKMTKEKSQAWYSMINAFSMMKADNNRGRYFNSRLYDLAKRHISETMISFQSGEKNSQYGKIWMTLNSVEIKIYSYQIEDYINQGWTNSRKAKEAKIKKQYDLICEICKAPFISYYKSTRFCNKKCQSKHNSNQRTGVKTGRRITYKGLPVKSSCYDKITKQPRKKPNRKYQTPNIVLNKCIFCGEFSNICNCGIHHNRSILVNLIKYFKLDISNLGTLDFINSWNNCQEYAKSLYAINSLPEIAKSVGITNVSIIKNCLKYLGINRRSFSESQTHYLNNKRTRIS